ncbi:MULTISPECIES: LEA type 2 family protein [unclassified Pseudomonas]|uniref:LEA type 2 family protein n=1 Tax=unclassified Pseudomonas TaxID=196821 RepID=UPI00215C9BF9|nr:MULTISPECIES: LEA type 2 family protein [unclassified Pseudomonas]MCR8932693.1 LEA type 2 family protein [Pseudomonas sp. S11A4]MCR8976297.1 LEA type 2 family protein [Pseudomonas sp. S11P7]
MLGQRHTLRWLLLMLVLNLGGCASWFSDDSVDPAVHLVKVEVVRAKLLEQRFILHFRVDNPNDSELTVRGLEYRIHLADMLLAEGEHEHWFTVRPKHSAYFKVPIRTNLWPKVKDVVKMLKKTDQQIPYRLEGEMETGLFIAHYVHLKRNGVIIPADLIPEQHR